MTDYRSNLYGEREMQIEPYYDRPSSSTRPNDFRSYSTSSATSHHYTAAAPVEPPPRKLKKGKSIGGATSKSWGLDDGEFQRKKRVASYKAYSVEGKIKGSFRKSIRWIKDRYSKVAYGWG